MDAGQNKLMVLQQTFKNHIKVAEFTISTTIMFTIGWLYYNLDPDYLLVIGVFQGVVSLPALFNHLEYTIKNFGQKFTINANGFTVEKGNKTITYLADDLSKVTLYKAASLDSWGIPRSPYEYYHFAQFITVTGEEIILTCLLSKNLEDEIKRIKGLKYIRKKKSGFLFLRDMSEVTK